VTALVQTFPAVLFSLSAVLEIKLAACLSRFRLKSISYRIVSYRCSFVRRPRAVGVGPRGCRPQLITGGPSDAIKSERRPNVCNQRPSGRTGQGCWAGRGDWSSLSRCSYCLIRRVRLSRWVFGHSPPPDTTS